MTARQDMLIRFPQDWPSWLNALTAVIVLACLDLSGSYAAKEAVVRRSAGWAVAGVTLFVLLFWVFASSLQYAELTPVTFGWIVVLQVGVLLLDRYRFGIVLGPGQWAAIAVIIAAQAYLLLAVDAPSGQSLTPTESTVAEQVL